MMTAVGVPGTATATPQHHLSSNATNNSIMAAAAAAAAVATQQNNGSNTSTGTTSSSLCSTPVNLLGQTALSFMQGGLPLGGYYPTSMTAPYGTPMPSVTAGNAFEGLPIFLLPQNGAANAATLPLAALQRQIAVQQHIAAQPKIDTSKHYHVFVGDLSSEVDNTMLKQAFNKFGEISEVKVIRDAQSLKSRGYGFVTFPRKEDAEAALQEMNGQMIGRRAVRTNWATRRTPEDEKKALSYDQIFNATASDNTTVYLGNLGTNTTEDAVREAFQKFGAIKEIRMFAQQNYGFVTYEAKESAAKAILEMSFEELDGQMLRCSWGRPTEPNNNTQLNHSSLMALTQLAGLSTYSAAAVAPPIQAAATAAWSPLYQTIYGGGLLPTAWH
uniref:Nucleolysin TIA-1/TIAR n=1 Tax=Panagrellus redivivus TaxID=6233 RepID=A0A7E4ZXV8_PANRE